MIIKFLLKIWPSIIPITLYIIWIFFSKFFIFKQNKSDYFLISNPKFIFVLYLTFISLIISLLLFVINSQKITNGQYTPARLENDVIIPVKNVN